MKVCNISNYMTNENFDRIFVENVYLLEVSRFDEIHYEKKLLRKQLFKEIVHIMYMLAKLSTDDIGLFNENGTIDISKWNLYFDLALEVKIKILIPQKLSIEEYVEKLMERT